MVRVTTLASFAALSFSVYGIELNADNSDSVKTAASALASGVVKYYNGNETGEIPGLLSMPYYWWEGGAMFDTLIQYWRLTGDAQYNAITTQALLFQKGEDDFMPMNQTATIGNDDQATWALAAMSAAEAGLPVVEGNPKWESLAAAVFDIMTLRWDEQTCNGGLRWQIFSFNNGYDYKNSISTGLFFQLSARLARYTGNSTYSDWADKSYTWAKSSGFIDEKWSVFDGAHATKNCTDINKLQPSYDAGTFISGAAHMYNLTKADSKWKVPLDGLLNNTLTTFFPGGIATEVMCEESGRCNTDMRAFKGLLAHNLIDTIQVAPYTADAIFPKLKSSAEAAAKVCDDECPLSWTGTGGEETSSGDLGSQLSALTVVQGLLVKSVSPPATQANGGGNASTTTSPTSGGAANAAVPSGTTSATPSPTTTGNAAANGIQRLGMGSLGMLLGSVAWVAL
ncbi:Six-hairpin glycosidase [Glarea lozoyensis ATCC 20868]|uniref:Mannan endo-1,6-alpha-mannosidase n=1 Tax=Glarea lozoyensis (strain ATCC 20868 / MF5171) TaxID=1116229 RepID=S3EAG8_GLAL2|nr:Six-hairpin glycosidase [Glarea lozoyensis ATCC 20868]EPE35293.1 Six-hairpin glycosidase [Glarea lozoyensis ATCC 20868]